MGSITDPNLNDMRNGVDSIAAVSVSARKSKSRRKPLLGAYLALLLFMVIYCARPEDWIPGLSHIPLAKISAILAVLASVLSLRHIRDRVPREFFFLFLLTIQLFVASWMSPIWRGGAVQESLDFAKVLIVVFVIMAGVTTFRRLRVLIFTQAIAVSAVAAVAIWKGRLLLGRLEGTLGGVYTDPNDMALAIVISIPLSIAMIFLSRNKLWKIFWSIAIFVMIYAVFLTGSRGGFLALIATAAVFLWEFGMRGRRLHFLVLAVLAGVVFLQFSGGMVVARLKGTLDSRGDVSAAYASGQERQQLFWRSIEVTEEHLLFGVGPGNFASISGSWHVTHNSFTQMSSEGGVPAFVLYVLILWCGFKNLKAAKRLARGKKESVLLARALLASLVGYVVGSTFLSLAYQFFPYFLVAYTTAVFSISSKAADQAGENESTRQISAKKRSQLELAASEIS
jgi:O-antigen ligase